MERVAHVSNVKDMTVISHSIGTRNMLMNLVENSTYFGSRVNYLALLAPFTEAHASTLLNSIFMNANILVDDYAPAFLKIHRSFKPGSFFNEIFRWKCGYATWYCDFLALYMSQTTKEHNNPASDRVHYSKFPGQSSFKNWRFIR